MTLNLPDRIGTNAGAAAEAGRLSAAADAAVRRVAFAAATANTDRDDPQAPVRADRAASRIPASGGADFHREDRARTSGHFVRRGPSPLFVAQLIGQDREGAAAPRATSAQGATAYPSMSFDQDIFLPGEEIVFAGSAPRIDIRV
ncbi:MAG: hypothetical protein JJ899_03250 [Alphaproteobacteria bacterium]|nr:hypothetical protein [Alphaproteobacteria bacterium]